MERRHDNPHRHRSLLRRRNICCRTGYIRHRTGDDVNLARKRQSAISELKKLRAGHRKVKPLAKILIQLTTKLIRQELRHG